MHPLPLASVLKKLAFRSLWWGGKTGDKSEPFLSPTSLSQPGWTPGQEPGASLTLSLYAAHPLLCFLQSPTPLGLNNSSMDTRHFSPALTGSSQEPIYSPLHLTRLAVGAPFQQSQEPGSGRSSPLMRFY